MFRWILTAPGKPTRHGVNVPADDMPSEGEMLFGEAGAEVVMPLRQLWAQLQRMAQQVAQTTAQNLSGGMPLVVEVHSHTYVDGQEVKETVVRHLIPDVRQATRAIGTPVLVGR